MKRLLAILLALFATAVLGADPKEPFTPRPQGCVTVSVTNVSAATALASPGAANAIVYNAGTATAFIEFCTSSTCTAAVASGFPTASSHKEALGLPANTSHVAAITSSGTATVYVCVGVGV